MVPGGQHSLCLSSKSIGSCSLSLAHHAEAHSEARRQKDVPIPSSTAQSPGQLGSTLNQDRRRNG